MAEMTTEDRVKDLERRMHTMEDAFDNLPARVTTPPAADEPDPPVKPPKK